eukprot:jgi/Ulvmu1/5869/UM025_0131.1
MVDAPDDLERILDDALDDYDASLHTTASALPAQADARGSKDGANTEAGAPETDALEPAATDATIKKAFNPLGKKPRKRASQQPMAAEPNSEQFQASLDGLAAAMEQMMRGDPGAPESTRSVQATLQQVNETARVAAEGSTGHIQHDPADSRPDDGQAEIQQMLDAMSQAMQGGGGQADSFVETLMHGLLSKEVLYDPLKDIADRFPEWLEANRGTLSEEELARYEAQLAYITEVLDLLEQHGDSKFDELLQLLQELQAMGQPPQELLAQMKGTAGGGPAAGLEDLPQCPIQ